MSKPTTVGKVTERNARNFNLMVQAAGDRAARFRYVELARACYRRGELEHGGIYFRRARETRVNELRLAVELGLRKDIPRVFRPARRRPTRNLFAEDTP